MDVDTCSFLEPLFPLRCLSVTLQFTQPSNPRFFHQPALSALLKFLLPGNIDDYHQYLVIDAVESGRIDYQAGDYYRLGIQCLAGGEALMESLMQALRALPDSLPPDIDEQKAFGQQLRWVNFSDALTENPVDSVWDLATYDITNLAQEVALWADYTDYTWQWLSPTRLLKAKSKQEPSQKKREKKTTGEARYCADAKDMNIPLLLERLYDTVAALLRQRGHPNLPPRVSAPPIASFEQTCFWVDSHYNTPNHKNYKPMGGMLGEHHIHWPEQFPHSPWLHFMVLGQYIGLGQRRSFGWGRYQLVTPEQGVTCRRLLAATPILERALTTSNLLSAFQHKIQRQRQNRSSLKKIQDKKKQASKDLNSTDKTSPPFYKWEQAFSDYPNLDTNNDDVSQAFNQHTQAEPTPSTQDLPQDEVPVALIKKAQQLAEYSYQVPDLKGVIIDKANGEWRALAIPPFYDGILQRAVAQTLTPMLDRLMDERSYGYRHGKSRQAAKEQVTKAYREGARWVFEADIDDFFDTVSIPYLLKRLRALFHQDPVNDVIAAWLQAPVKFQGELLKRQQGLPQGSPLSPVLANLLLDDFDADMRRAGLQCIRFADDFIVLCKTQEQAQQAKHKVIESLSEHGFELNLDKSYITPFERGFRFLGYLFVNDLALDVGSKYLEQDTVKKPPKQGWLADYCQKYPDKTLLSEPSDDGVESSYQSMPHHQRPSIIAQGQREESGTLLCISGSHTVISTAEDRIQIERNDQCIANTPWRGLRSVLLFGRHHITTPAMQAALEFQVPIHFARQNGRYLGALHSQQPKRGPNLWLLQERRSQDAECCLAVAKELVTSRIRHQQEVLRQRVWSGREALGDCLSQVTRCQTLDELLGVEGIAAKYYFDSIAQHLDKKWKFRERNRRPPKDPLNVLLSFGYTSLYAHTDTMIQLAGLSPTRGFYHQPRGRHAALASDLMEPFRHLVERCALTVLANQELSLEDFKKTDKGCLLSPGARKHYAAKLMQRFEQPLMGRDGRSGKLVDLLSHQNQRLIHFIRGQGLFTAWRQR